MTTEEASKRLGMPVQRLRCLMRAGKLPIGIAEKGKKEWCYYIYEEWVDRFIKGDPVQIPKGCTDIKN